MVEVRGTHSAEMGVRFMSPAMMTGHVAALLQEPRPSSPACGAEKLNARSCTSRSNNLARFKSVSNMHWRRSVRRARTAIESVHAQSVHMLYPAFEHGVLSTPKQGATVQRPFARAGADGAPRPQHSAVRT